MKKIFTQEYLKEAFDYDEGTGIITWKHRPPHHFVDERTMNKWNTRYANKLAGYKSKVYKSDNEYYWRMSLDNHPYDCHSLIWVWLYGTYASLIDHYDGNSLNNSKINLRETTTAKNIRKGKTQRNNTSGYKGVSYRNDTLKWAVRLKVNGKYKSLGSYDDIVYASRVYSTAVLILEGEVFSESEPFDINTKDYKNVLNKL